VPGTLLALFLLYRYGMYRERIDGQRMQPR